jgi:hypothetical protein
VNGNAGLDQVGDDSRLQVRKRQHEVGLERENLADISRDKCRDAGLFPPDLWRPHRIARDPDDPGVLAQ